jgi:cytochrome c oxidase subunit 3
MKGNESAVEEALHRDDTRAKIGMWLFLFTELILFGGLFLLYSAYRFRHPEEFHSAAKELDLILGSANTAILLTSSFTMVLSIYFLRKGKKAPSILVLGMTVLLGLFFLCNKYIEWSAKIHHGIYPNSPELLGRSHGEILFFGLYYVMTGLHGLHVLIGVVVLSVMMVLIGRDRITPTRNVALENAGLYWHLVDIIWIYLFPLFYLIT